MFLLFYIGVRTYTRNRGTRKGRRWPRREIITRGIIRRGIVTRGPRIRLSNKWEICNCFCEDVSLTYSFTVYRWKRKRQTGDKEPEEETSCEIKRQVWNNGCIHSYNWYNCCLMSFTLFLFSDWKKYRRELWRWRWRWFRGKHNRRTTLTRNKKRCMKQKYIVNSGNRHTCF